MLPLAELQAQIAHAVVSGDCERAAAALAGGADPARRLAVHARHFVTSLTGALREKFPATTWLLGTDLVAAAAHAYVRARPPHRPCIAEYGADFPAFLGEFDGTRTPPYASAFAALEWAVGRASIAVAAPSLAWSDVARLGAQGLLDATLELQPGLEYLRFAWAVDELMKMYLSGCEAETFVLRETDTCIEVRGSRGSLALTRLDPATFTFRAALREGQTIGAAASAALDSAAAFDAGAALRELVHAGLAIAVARAPRGSGS
ncbi:MAG TPA: DNA-binding domain-containing protein [Gammaproteobacteria bacterium]